MSRRQTDFEWQFSEYEQAWGEVPGISIAAPQTQMRIWLPLLWCVFGTEDGTAM